MYTDFNLYCIAAGLFCIAAMLFAMVVQELCYQQIAYFGKYARGVHMRLGRVTFSVRVSK